MFKKFLVFVLIFLISFVYAVPGKINYQGRLMENGNVINGSKTMSFYLYINSVETPLLTDYSVGINNGIYNVELPINQELLPSNNEQVSLRVYIDGNNSTGTRLSPDIQMVALPYAIHSETAAYAEKASAIEDVEVTSDGTITTFSY